MVLADMLSFEYKFEVIASILKKFNISTNCGVIEETEEQHRCTLSWTTSCSKLRFTQAFELRFSSTKLSNDFCITLDGLDVVPVYRKHCISYYFFLIHSFIHSRHLYSASLSGATQKRSQPQRGRTMLFKVAEGISGRILYRK